MTIIQLHASEKSPDKYWPITSVSLLGDAFIFSLKSIYFRDSIWSILVERDIKFITTVIGTGDRLVMESQVKTCNATDTSTEPVVVNIKTNTTFKL